mmetsp:Transcript_76166/g.227006  ORF Transcript_76166/g.227006 Transcript_76166/m.227006 type:complete len:225 (-) Transcript_76166:165-839(-)
MCLEELGKQAHGDHTANGSPKKEDPVGTHPGMLPSGRIPDALHQPSVRGDSVLQKAPLRWAISILRVPIPAIVDDQDVDAEPLMHLLDILKPVANVARIPVEVDEGVRHLPLRQLLRRLVDEPRVEPRPVLREDPGILVRQPPGRRAAELVWVVGRRPLRAGWHRDIDDGALPRHQDAQQDEQDAEADLDQPHQTPEDQPQQPERRALLAILAHRLGTPPEEED